MTGPYLSYISGLNSSKRSPRQVKVEYITLGCVDLRYGKTKSMKFLSSLRNYFLVPSAKIPISTRLVCYAYQFLLLRPS